MFLPAMHERYGFLAEILVICLAFAIKNVWIYLIATLINVVSIINYVGTMFCAIPVFFKLLLIVNIFAYICLTYFVLKQGVQQDTALEEIIETV